MGKYNCRRGKSPLNLKTPIVIMRPTAKINGFTYGFSKCLLRVIPDMDMKKMKMTMKYIHSEYCDRIWLGWILSTGKNRVDGISP